MDNHSKGTSKSPFEHLSDRIMILLKGFFSSLKWQWRYIHFKKTHFWMGIKTEMNGEFRRSMYDYQLLSSPGIKWQLSESSDCITIYHSFPRTNVCLLLGPYFVYTPYKNVRDEVIVKFLPSILPSKWTIWSLVDKFREEGTRS